MHPHEYYMSRCIQLAKLGKGKVAPNPLVGAVIVHEDKIIGEGYHQKFGEAHAEVNAINSVRDKSILSEATIYVSLEPCAHHGKTPPCANLLAETKFKKVVVGCADSYAEVNGKGIQYLRNSGIDLEVGILENECRELNKHFFTFHTKKRPFVFLKWAESSNGFLDDQSKRTWISAPETQVLVHKWRSEHQAILVGRKTVQNDNPSLTVRAVDGTNPIRVVLDSENKLPNEAAVFNDEADTIVLNTLRNEVVGNISYVKLDEMTPANILKELHFRNIQSIMVEGGGQTLKSFIESNLWDEAMVIVGQVSFEGGTPAPEIELSPVSTEKFFSDTISKYRNP